MQQQASTTFAAQGVKEREHLQAALRDNIDALSPVPGDLLVLEEEYSDWEDSSRRIDLLAVDRSGALVVIELKRTIDAGHAELQALRYAAMVNGMSFERGAEALARHRTRLGDVDGAARASADLRDFLTPPDESADPSIVFGRTVRIVLASADFSRELTHTVLWLRDESDLDMRCVRLTPYTIDGKAYLYAEQIIPLPVEGDYRVRMAARERAERNAARQGAAAALPYAVFLNEQSLTDGPVSRRRAFGLVVRALVDAGVSPDDLAGYLKNAGLWCRIEGIATPDDFKAKLRAENPNDAQVAGRYDLKPEYLISHGNATYALRNQNSAGQLPMLADLAATKNLRWEALLPGVAASTQAES
ncbi:MAG: hypothetical protein HYV19_03375 [Gemmatimonadetes bacterium]|nr:hypothetical protein [Gemmatimonadota bacterium]